MQPHFLAALVLLAGCPAPSIGAACTVGTARCNDGQVEHCDCANLGGSGPFGMDVCTSSYQWMTYLSEGCEDGETCVSDGDYAGCAAVDAAPCISERDDPWCDGQVVKSCVPLAEGPRAVGSPDHSGPGRWKLQTCDATQRCVAVTTGPYPRAFCEGDPPPT